MLLLGRLLPLCCWDWTHTRTQTHAQTVRQNEAEEDAVHDGNNLCVLFKQLNKRRAY